MLLECGHLEGHTLLNTLLSHLTMGDCFLYSSEIRGPVVNYLNATFPHGIIELCPTVSSTLESAGEGNSLLRT